MEAGQAARSRRAYASPATESRPARTGPAATASPSSFGLLPNRLVCAHGRETLANRRKRSPCGARAELFQSFCRRRSGRRTRIEVAPEPDGRDLQIVPVGGFIASEKREPSVQQAEFQVLTQEKRLGRTDQARIGALDFLYPDKLIELAEQLRAQVLPKTLRFPQGRGSRLRTRVLHERQGIHARDQLIQFCGQPRDIQAGPGFEALYVAGESLAQRQELRAPRACQ